jgi:hypothetical protein
VKLEGLKSSTWTLQLLVLLSFLSPILVVFIFLTLRKRILIIDTGPECYRLHSYRALSYVSACIYSSNHVSPLLGQMQGRAGIMEDTQYNLL